MLAEVGSQLISISGRLQYAIQWFLGIELPSQKFRTEISDIISDRFVLNYAEFFLVDFQEKLLLYQTRLSGVGAPKGSQVFKPAGTKM